LILVYLFSYMNVIMGLLPHNQTKNIQMFDL